MSGYQRQVKILVNGHQYYREYIGYILEWLTITKEFDSKLYHVSAVYFEDLSDNFIELIILDSPRVSSQIILNPFK